MHRLDLAFAAFFRRPGSSEAPGYSRFKPGHRWQQLEFPHGDRALRLNVNHDRVRIPGVGTVRLRKGREIPAFGRAFVVEKNGRWYAVFEGRREPEALPSTGQVLGVDRGVHVLCATSGGELIADVRAHERHRRVVTRLARELDDVRSKMRLGVA